MPAVNLYTGATKTTTEDPYATQPVAPATSAPAPVASDPYAGGVPLGGSTGPALTTTPPVATTTAPPPDRPWWEQARTNLGEMIAPGPITPAPEPRDPSVKPETPTAESQGFLPSTTTEWEMQLPDGSWVPYTYDLPLGMQAGGKVKDPTWSWQDGQYGWQEAETLRYDPGTTWRIAPTQIINGTTQVYDPVTVRRRSGSGSVSPSPQSASTTPGTTNATPAPATTTSPTTTADPTAQAQTGQATQPATWDGYLNNPVPAGSSASSTTPSESPEPQSSQPYATSPAPVAQSAPVASTPAPSSTTYRSSSAPATPPRTTVVQDAGGVPSGQWNRYMYEGGGSGTARDDEPWSDPIFARYFQVLRQQHGSDRARQMMWEMVRNGRMPRGARAVNLVPGENGFLENLTRH